VFLRKLTVLVVPLLLLAAVCLLLPLLTPLGFAGAALKGLLAGTALALLLPLSGASRRREPFAGLLWLPALLTLALLVCQYLLLGGTDIPVMRALATSDSEVVLAEGAFAAFMAVFCVRTKK